MYKILLVGVAGFAGTLARYWLGSWADSRWGPAFPIGTLIVNLVGCLAIGFLFQLTQEKYLVDPVISHGHSCRHPWRLHDVFILRDSDVQSPARR
jgi:fluoride ion exporter CrcB/FEX